MRLNDLIKIATVRIFHKQHDMHTQDATKRN